MDGAHACVGCAAARAGQPCQECGAEAVLALETAPSGLVAAPVGRGRRGGRTGPAGSRVMAATLLGLGVALRRGMSALDMWQVSYD